jgi:hypothetical protein
MPTCKNDCKRYYRGDEPSPKGLGYCAHAEKINQRRKGRDGKFWVVKAVTMKTGKRIRRWTRVKKVVTKKRKTTKATKKKSKLKGGVHPYAGRAIALALQKKQQRIAELKKQLRQCNEDEYKIIRQHDGEPEEVKRAALAPLKQKCDRIHTKLQRLGALR